MINTTAGAASRYASDQKLRLRLRNTDFKYMEYRAWVPTYIALADKLLIFF
jgi:hypothetical protein